MKFMSSMLVLVGVMLVCAGCDKKSAALFFAEEVDAIYATPLHHAAYNNDVEVVEELLSTGSDVNALDFNERTPLHRAAMESDPAIAKMLIDAGADVNRTDIWGKTPLSYAKDWGDKETINLLIDAGGR